MPALIATRAGPVHPLYTLRTSLPDPSGQGEWNMSPELYGRRGRLRASRDCTIQNTPVYAHFHINYIIQEEGLRLRSALSLVKKPYRRRVDGLMLEGNLSMVTPSASSIHVVCFIRNKDIRIFFDGTCLRTNSIPFSYRFSELQSLAPVGHDVAIYINLLNPHVDQLDDLTHIAAWQARAEALADSLIEVDVDTKTDPRDLDPDKLDLRKERSLSRSPSLIRYTRHASVDMDLIMSDSSDEEDNLSDLDRPGPGTGDGTSIDLPAPSFNDVCSTFSVRHRQQERRYELQERAHILALDPAIAGQCSTVEVELLYVNHALAYHPTAFEKEEAASLVSKSKDFLAQQMAEL
ncbi:hypothetical protein B0H17DRAFT_1201400 [Mycena rosella]|uniref:Uncharacterized protein n=1 Tax=Mycena rosella TaxID=1033263 RepID=A0AAD7DJ62_MYCRO|nr:hypothetical protein B0H17DRAFT_1201400 [Mycena rosella]